MPEDTGGQERTEQATQRRRDEARKRGQVARSIEVNTAAVLLAGFVAIAVFNEFMLNQLESSINFFFVANLAQEVSFGNIQVLAVKFIMTLVYTLTPLFIVLSVVAIGINVVQVGFLITGETLQPKAEKVNPMEGFKRIFSRRTLETLIRDIIKVVIFAWIGFTSVRGILGELMVLSDASPGQIFVYVGDTIFSIVIKIIIAYIILAVFDYAFQKWDHEKSLMMTKQEVKEELKQMEGDPMLRARIRQVQREMAQSRMMEEVPGAEVVITNPTHLAIALSYQSSMNAPTVIAKGQNRIAQRIREVAEEAGVPIVENISLAQTLYKAVDIGSEIPEELYTAVAEVLAYVYRLKGKGVDS